MRNWALLEVSIKLFLRTWLLYGIQLGVSTVWAFLLIEVGLRKLLRKLLKELELKSLRRWLKLSKR
jgi:hypothetical protein